MVAQFLDRNRNVPRDFQRIANRLSGNIKADGCLSIHARKDARVFGDKLNKGDISHLRRVIDRQLVNAFHRDSFIPDPQRKRLGLAFKRAQGSVIAKLGKRGRDVKDGQPAA